MSRENDLNHLKESERGMVKDTLNVQRKLPNILLKAENAVIGVFDDAHTNLLILKEGGTNYIRLKTSYKALDFKIANKRRYGGIVARHVGLKNTVSSIRSMMLEPMADKILCLTGINRANERFDTKDKIDSKLNHLDKRKQMNLSHTFIEKSKDEILKLILEGRREKIVDHERMLEDYFSFDELEDIYIHLLDRNKKIKKYDIVLIENNALIKYYTKKIPVIESKISEMEAKGVPENFKNFMSYHKNFVDFSYLKNDMKHKCILLEETNNLIAYAKSKNRLVQEISDNDPKLLEMKIDQGKKMMEVWDLLLSDGEKILRQLTEKFISQGNKIDLDWISQEIFEYNNEVDELTTDRIKLVEKLNEYEKELNNLNCKVGH